MELASPRQVKVINDSRERRDSERQPNFLERMKKRGLLPVFPLLCIVYITPDTVHIVCTPVMPVSGADDGVCLERSCVTIDGSFRILSAYLAYRTFFCHIVRFFRSSELAITGLR